MAVKKAIPMQDFGKDHYSLLAYVETLCVDSSKGGVGEIDKRRVRCNPRRHPLHNVNANMGVTGWKPDWGTRLSGFWTNADLTNPKRQIGFHDDWDCLDDLDAAGLLEVLSEANGYVKLTDKGLTVAGLLRAWKAKGGMFETFQYSESKL